MSRWLVGKLVLAAVVVMGSAISACGQVSSAPPEYGDLLRRLAPGKGAIVGQVIGADRYWPGRSVYVWAAQYVPSAEGGGAYLLEPALFPKVQVDEDGYFQLVDLPPRQYVLLVGPMEEASMPLREGDRARIVDVDSGRITDVGVISIVP